MANTLSLPPETRGVWYCCGHKVNTLPGHDYIYSGPMATYCAWHRPMTVFSPDTQRAYGEGRRGCTEVAFAAGQEAQ